MTSVKEISDRKMTRINQNWISTQAVSISLNFSSRYNFFLSPSRKKEFSNDLPVRSFSAHGWGNIKAKKVET